MRFSQRAGITPASKLSQRESIDDDLRSTLWSLLSLCYWDTYTAPDYGMYDRADRVRKSNLYELVFHYGFITSKLRQTRSTSTGLSVTLVSASTSSQRSGTKCMTS